MNRRQLFGFLAAAPVAAMAVRSELAAAPAPIRTTGVLLDPGHSQRIIDPGHTHSLPTAELPCHSHTCSTGYWCSACAPCVVNPHYHSTPLMNPGHHGYAYSLPQGRA
jgi:hypothetical protein